MFPSSRDGQAPAGKTEGRSRVTGVEMAGRDGRRFPQHPTLSTLTTNQHSLKNLQASGPRPPSHRASTGLSGPLWTEHSRVSRAQSYAGKSVGGGRRREKGALSVLFEVIVRGRVLAPLPPPSPQAALKPVPGSKSY